MLHQDIIAALVDDRVRNQYRNSKEDRYDGNHHRRTENETMEAGIAYLHAHGLRLNRPALNLATKRFRIS